MLTITFAPESALQTPSRLGSSWQVRTTTVSVIPIHEVHLILPSSIHQNYLDIENEIHENISATVIMEAATSVQSYRTLNWWLKIWSEAHI